MAVENVSAAATQLPIRQDWLDLHVEEIIEPAMPIVDPHHHLWDLPGRRYLFDEFLRDIDTGHNICASVFAQCHSMYRADGREVGGPIGLGPFEGRRHDVFKRWEQDIRALASFPNTLMKLGGMAMRSTGFAFYKQDRPPSSEQLCEAWRPYFTTCVESFGPARCMFESNFPVDKAMCSYPVLWNAFKRLAAGFSPVEKTALFSGTAAKAYRLNIKQA